MTVLEWIKANAKTDANIAEVEEMLEASKLPESKEAAWDFIQKNKVFKSALDAEISRATAAHDEKFMATKLPDIMKAEKEKLIKELHPEETPLEKRVREQDERIKAFENEKLDNSRKEVLRKKAVEIGFNPVRAERYSVYGDEAENVLVQDYEYMQTFVKENVEKEAKKRYGNGNIPQGGGNPNQKLITLDALNDMMPKERSAYFAAGGGVIPE